MAQLNRCIFAVTSGGTGTFSEGSVPTGFQSMEAAGATNGEIYSYAAQSSDLTQWEVGTGVCTIGSPSTLSRSVLFNSLGTTAAVNFSAPPQVKMSVLAENIPHTVQNAAPFPVTSSAVLADIPGLEVAVRAGRSYTFRATLFVSAGAISGGFKAAIKGTCSASDIVYVGYAFAELIVMGYTQVTALGATVVSDSTGSTDTALITIYGTITVSVAGTLTVQFAQQTSSLTPTVVRQGSTFIVEDVT